MATLEPDSRSVPDLYIELCRAHLSHGKKTEASASLEKGLNIFPNDIQLLIEYGRLLGDEGKASEILPRLESAILDLANLMEIFKLMASMYKSVGEKEEAIAAYRVFLGYGAFKALLKSRRMGPTEGPEAKATLTVGTAPGFTTDRQVRLERKKRAIATLSVLQERVAKGLYH